MQLKQHAAVVKQEEALNVQAERAKDVVKPVEARILELEMRLAEFERERAAAAAAVAAASSAKTRTDFETSTASVEAAPSSAASNTS